jgi:hypothetical protein
MQIGQFVIYGPQKKCLTEIMIVYSVKVTGRDTFPALMAYRISPADCQLRRASSWPSYSYLQTLKLLLQNIFYIFHTVLLP